ncbi:hypothetical protein BH11PSE8_BH11PSE8_24310 [soil metagenome]
METSSTSSGSTNVGRESAIDDEPAELAHIGKEGLEGSVREERIRHAAYRRYMERGGAAGGDVEDWLLAEAEVDQSSAG